jgi:hypothetical protein
MGRDRPVVDDAASTRALVLHDPERVLRAQEHACQVRVDDGAPRLERQILDRDGRRTPAGIVEEQIQPAIGLARLPEQVLDIVRQGHVAGHDKGAAGLSLGGHLVERLAAPT